jgi:hypothetical protein
VIRKIRPSAMPVAVAVPVLATVSVGMLMGMIM